MNPWALLGIMLAAGLLTGGAYWQGRQDGAAGELASQKREEDVARVAREAAMQSAAEAISKIKIQHRTVQQEVQREISERVVYRECVHSPEQLQRINAAITGRSAEPSGGGELPRAHASDGSVVRSDDVEAGGGGGAVP